MLESHYNRMTDYTVALSSEEPFLNISLPTVAGTSSLHMTLHWVIHSHLTLPLEVDHLPHLHGPGSSLI